MTLIHAVRPHHFALAGFFYRSFRHTDMSVLALKRLYTGKGLLPDEEAPLPIVEINDIDELATFLSGPAEVLYGMYPHETQHEPDKAV